MKVLLVDAHPDDVEISCAGTISRLKREGHIIWSVYFCPCIEDPRNEGHIEDHKRACKLLQIDNLISYSFPRNELEEHKSDVRFFLYKIREEYKPNIVICPTIHDFHQDHKAVAECCLTIFRDTSTILGCEVIRSVMPEFKPNLFIILTRKDRNIKIAAIECYKSQIKARPYFFSTPRLLSHIEMRGTQAKANWAEAYELMWGRV